MKPSPVPSILLFAATAILLFSLLGRGWYSINEDSLSMSSGPLWSKFCFENGGEMECQTHTIFSSEGGMNIFRITGILFALTALTATILSGIAAIFLLNKQRTALALVSLILIGVATLIELGMFVYGMSKGGRGGMPFPGYGFFLYFLGATLVIVGSIMAMKRGGPAPRPAGYGYPPGPQYGYGAPPYQAAPGYPPNQPPAYAQQQAPQPMPVAGPAGAPEGAAPQATPPHGCGTPMTWVGQYNRWFCPRCNQYG